MTAPPTPTCSRCGEAISAGARFCMKCGADVSGQQSGVATAMMPAAQEREADEIMLEMLRKSTIGEYEIFRELGRGGMATVYLAHDIALDRKVAIKVMSPALLLMGEGMVERFKREARTAASLSHPHIIPIYTVKSTGKSLFFVMKFIAGCSLENVIRQVGPMPIPLVKAVLQQVGSALGFAHRHGIVHRDVKPANVMLDEEGWSVVTDFGIAKVAENRGLTMTGIAVGTPSYMSPEQCAAKDITGKSDQYSLGVVAYEMLSGKQPFEGDSAMAIMFAHFHEQPKPLRELRPDCPPDLADAVMRALEKAPDKRWSSMEDWIGAIGAAPLAHDDPTHILMQELARLYSNRDAGTIPLPPTSPVPPGRHSAAEAATTPVPAPRAVSVAVTPAKGDVHVGDTLQLAAAPRLANGGAATEKVTWSSSDPAIATVSPTGLVTGLAPGPVTITAVCDQVKGTATLAVVPAPVAAVHLNPNVRSLTVGESLKLTAALRDARGADLGERKVEWSSAAPAVASVGPDGTVTGKIPGVVEIVATCEKVKGTARISITPAPAATVAVSPVTINLATGESATLEAAVKDARGNVLRDRKIEWASSDSSVGTVSPAGVVVARAPGTTQVTATVEGIKASASLKVVQSPVASIIVAHPEPVVAGEMQQLTATLKDSRGGALEGRPIKWSSSNAAVATVSGEGTVAGVTPGSAKITAECEGKTWTVAVTVLPIPVAALEISGAPDQLEPGSKATLVATVRDARGNPLPDRKVDWSSSSGSVATVSGAGVVTAKKPGSVTITAACEGRQATATLAVVLPPKPVEPPPPAPPLAEAAPPPPPLLPEPAAVEPVAAFGGAVVSEAPPVEEPPAAPEAPPMAEIPTEVVRRPTAEVRRSTTTGLRRPTEPVVLQPAAPAAGRGKLIGAAIGVAVLLAVGGYLVLGRGSKPSPAPAPEPGPAPVHAAVATVVVNPPGGPITVGRTIQLGAVVRDASGHELSNRTLSWVSSDPATATVDLSGAVTAKRAGRARITATSEGKTGTVELTIGPAAAGAAAAVASVVIAPVNQPLEVGGTLQLSAAVKDSKGAELADRPIVWSTSDQAVATVNSTGLVSAAAGGSVTITASSESKSGSVKLTVNPPKAGPAPAPPPAARLVASLELKTPARSIKVGDTTTWTVVAKDRSGAAVTDRPISWSSNNAGVATVAGGVIRGVAAGRAEIKAEADGKQQVQTITIEAATATQPPPPTPGPAASAALLPKRAAVAGGALSCGIAGDAAVCWGGGQTAPSLVAGAKGVTDIVAGRGHACAIASGGHVLCWGENKAGQLGDGTTTGREAAAPIKSDQTFSALAAGTQHTCGIAGGKAWCWGDNGSGQLGDGSTNGRSTPVQVKQIKDVVSIAAGQKHSCAVVASGKAYCWGDGFSGQLGYGELDQQTEPYEVSDDHKFTQIAVGFEHSCALDAGGKAWCWGSNKVGQLGDGSTDDRRRPKAVSSGETFSAIAAGGSVSCALSSAGQAFCWGANKAGQLGDGSKRDQSKPVAVGGGRAFSSISVGEGHVCGVTRSGEPVCWGRNDRGQLGDGTTNPADTPAPVKSGGS